jgi:hypothetical protein
MASRTTDPRRDGTSPPDDERPIIELPPVPEIDDDDDESEDEREPGAYIALVERAFGDEPIAELGVIQEDMAARPLADVRRLLALARLHAETATAQVTLIEAEIAAREYDIERLRTDRELAYKEAALQQNERMIRQQEAMQAFMEGQAAEGADNPFGGPISLSGLKG